MTCNACGDGPKKKDNSFTKAVIEINNPETLVLFRKVVIPASMGDEETVPPVVGKYHNVLLVYEANNNAYLYSSDGIPTLLTSDVAATIEARVDALEIGLADETATRKSVDKNLQGQIDQKANITDLSTVATTGDYDDLSNKPTIGDATLTIQRNSTDLGTFSANATSNVTLDISVPTTPSDIGAQPLIDANNKLDADLVDDTNSTHKFATAAQLSAIGTALQPADIDKTVVSDVAVNDLISTSTVNLDVTTENLLSGVSSTNTIALPVASTTEAGVMNSSTYDAVTSNTNNINALLNGAVAVTGLSASPLQSDITTAWQTETGLTTLINRASVYDITNDKVWTYYTNDTTWHAASNTTQVTVNQATNSSLGTVKGSTNTGQAYVENDGTLSVNGWDAMSAQVGDNTSNIGDLQTAVAGKQDKLTAGTNITITSNTISATDTTYTAGTGLDLNGTEFSVDTTEIQEKLTAGDAIDITGNVISADIEPADYFTASGTVNGEGSTLTLNNTIKAKLADLDLLGDSSQQTYSGKNKADFTTIAFSGSNNGTGTRDGNSFTVTSAADSANSGIQFTQANLNLKPDTTYTFSAKIVSTSSSVGSTLYISANMSSSGSGIFGNQAMAGETSTATFTTVSSIPSGASIRLYGKEAGATAVFKDLQIEESSTATPYEPYTGGEPAPSPSYPQAIQSVTGEQSIRINGKNLWGGVPAYSRSTNGIDFTTNADGTITASGTASANAYSILTSAAYSAGVYIALEAGTYTLSEKNNNIVQAYEAVSGSTVLADTSTSTVTFTLAEPKNILIRAEVPNGTAIGGSMTFYPMLEAGSTPTAYEPYQGTTYTVDLGSIELCKIGEYQDYIYKSGSDWYLHKETVKQVFDGTENWNYGSINTYYRGSLTFSNWKPSQQNFYNSHFIAGNTGSVPNVCGIGSTQVFMSVDASLGITTKAQWLTWLGNNNVTMYTILDTPTDIKITDASLISQLNALRNATSYNPQTNLMSSATSPNLPVILGVAAYRNSSAGTIALLESVPESQVQADWTQADSTAVDYIKNKPTLAAVATSGDYDDLIDKPSLATVATSGLYSDLTGTPSLATVATSGSYNDLSDKPTIPTVNNATLTIQKNGTTIQTFTANSSTNKTANISVPVITMTNTDPGEGSVLAAGNFIGVYGGASPTFDYSTTETDTGATWIDGSHIYKKTVDTGTLPNATAKNVAHNISNLNRVIRLEGYTYNPTSLTTAPLPFCSPATSNIAVNVNSTNITVTTGIDRTSFSESYITLYYTKSA